MTFFFDNNLAPRTARALRELGYDVIHIREHFSDDGSIPDEVWMRECAKQGWVAISHDKAILAKPHLRAALLACGLVIFFLKKSLNALDPREMMIAFLKAWPEIESASEKARPGKRWFFVTANGKVEPISE